jgi:hypothetical protein
MAVAAVRRIMAANTRAACAGFTGRGSPHNRSSTSNLQCPKCARQGVAGLVHQADDFALVVGSVAAALPTTVDIRAAQLAVMEGSKEQRGKR